MTAPEPGAAAAEPFDVVVIGGGQAGLSAAWHLSRHGLRYRVLEAAGQLGQSWRSRWDSLRLFTPAERDALPGLPFPAPAGSYPGKDAVADYLQAYAAAFDLPVELDARVTALRRTEAGFQVSTAGHTVAARQVIVATGPFQTPYVPPFAAGLDGSVTQLHSSEYRSPGELPDGPVLVVGGGNSGFQIAADLAQTRPVELSVGSAYPALPQRLLGRDLFWWLTRLGLMRVTAASRLGRRVQARGEFLIGTDRRRLQRAGVRFRPRLVDAAGRTARFADGSSRDVDVVLWATGYRTDHTWLDVPGVVRDGRVAHSAASPTSPACTSSACPGSTPAARRCWASSGTTPPTWSTGWPPGPPRCTATATPPRAASRRAPPPHLPPRRLPSRHTRPGPDRRTRETAMSRTTQHGGRRSGRETSGEKVVAFPVYPGVTPLDLVGPLTVLRTTTRTPYRTVVVAERAEQLPTDTPLGIVPAVTFADVPAPWAVIVPGGGPAALAATGNEALIGYVRSAAAGAELVGSTGNGALLLAAAGLLHGKRAAIHWAYAEPLERLGAIHDPGRWVEDGPLLTAAGGTAGIDTALLARRSRLEIPGTRLAQLFMEYDPQPPFGRVQPGAGDDALARVLRKPTASAAAGADDGGQRHIAFVLYPGLTVLDLIGPLQVLTGLERFAPEYRTVVVGAAREPVPTDVGLPVAPDATFAEVPQPDVLVVPGGALPTIRAMSDPAVRDYVRTAAASADLVTSVCTGSLVLAAVGLLEGRDATTNWFYSGILESLGATYHQRRWVEDGDLVTSAGVSAGIDMALHLVARLTDEATARRVQLAIDYDPHPPYGGIDCAHIPPLPRAVRRAISLAAPVVVARPERLTRAYRRAAAGTQPVARP
ncbi:FAD-dependent oxidoreductase [Geodermatophilus maliterrae]|uniref:FAD-dependent oxidoreductase n=1 Tax=Geodermatophilus maliterrae TaxID=3162531 RepID=A0ABV3XM15_9ACTN